jgi:small subunit ribosomal protein S8
MQSDPLADFLTCIRNAARASKSEVRVPWSRMRSDVAHILKNEGYVTDVEKVADEKAKAGKPELLVKLRGAGQDPRHHADHPRQQAGPPPVRRRR